MTRPKNEPEREIPCATAIERRAWVRYSCDLDFSCQPIAVGNDNRWLGRVLNLSRGGACLVVGRRFERGTILAIELQSGAQSVTGPLLARVAHCTPQSHSDWLIGCSFVRELSEEELQALVPNA
jgi:hypothetical protein